MDYSQFYLCVASDLTYNFTPKDRKYKFDSGIRLGVGFWWAELSIGYAFREKALYMGTSIYIGFDQYDRKFAFTSHFCIFTRFYEEYVR